MVMFTILLIALALVAAIALTIVGVVGGTAVALFGDLFVFGIIVWAIIKLIKAFRKRKK